MMFVCAGLATVEEGLVNGSIISLKSTSVGRMSNAKDPQVLQVRTIETYFAVFVRIFFLRWKERLS